MVKEGSLRLVSEHFLVKIKESEFTSQDDDQISSAPLLETPVLNQGQLDSGQKLLLLLPLSDGWLFLAEKPPWGSRGWRSHFCTTHQAVHSTA